MLAHGPSSIRRVYMRTEKNLFIFFTAHLEPNISYVAGRYQFLTKAVHILSYLTFEKNIL